MDANRPPSRSQELGSTTSDSPEALQVRSWYAVYTSSRHEKRVVDHFHSRNIECFLPLYRKLRHWKNGCRVQVEFPLFSNYVFVHIARPERIRVLQVPGVVSFVGTARGPQPISASEIELLRDRIHEFRNLEPHPYLNAGDRVRILIGPLSGLEGILVRKKNNLRLILTVEAIRKSFSIEVDADSVESVITTAVTFGRRSQK